MLVRTDANDPNLSVPPVPRRVMDDTVAGLAAPVLAVRQGTAVRDVRDDLLADATSDAWPVIDQTHRPVGLLSRRALLESSPHSESEGQTVCRLMDASPLVADEALSFDALCDMLHRDGGRHLTTGFVITRNGVCLGLGTAPSVFRRLAERREAVRFQMAHHDSLTGLPNRQLFADRLQQAVARARRSGHPVAVLYVDVDRLKDVNESLGHATGDRLLGAFAGRLRGIVRESDTVARLSGDKFGIVLVEMPDPGSAEVVARKVLDVCQTPHSVDGEELSLSCSIGVAVFPDDADTQPALLRAAADAVHAAKQVRHTWQRYSRAMQRESPGLPFAFSSLRRAIDEHRFEVYYQPVLSLATGAMTGAEALLRWRDPVRGMMPTADVIRVAEDTGLIVPIGEQVMRMAMTEALSWRATDGSPLTLALNVSGVQFRDGALVPMVRRLLDETGFPPSSLILEITESTAMHPGAGALTALYQLRALGIRLSIDDFGTGYSSLSRLQRLPVDALKIDRSFVQHIGERPDGGVIAATIITMAHSLGLTVTAEGVETQAQLSLLTIEACDDAQGYLMSVPVPAAEMSALLRSGVNLLTTLQS